MGKNEFDWEENENRARPEILSSVPEEYGLVNPETCLGLMCENFGLDPEKAIQMALLVGLNVCAKLLEKEDVDKMQQIFDASSDPWSSIPLTSGIPKRILEN